MTTTGNGREHTMTALRQVQTSLSAAAPAIVTVQIAT